MPGDDWRKINKATTLDVDCICMDTEDGVALNRKEAARETIVRALAELDFGRSERLVRVNPVGSAFVEDDLAALVPARPDGVVVPKVASAADIEWVSKSIADVESAHGWKVGDIRLLAIVESAAGIANLKEIASAGPRLDALIFGAEDLAGDIGAVRTPAGWEVFYARSAVVIHAAANSLQAIDMVRLDYRDLDGLLQEARQGAGMGFDGKQVIHPDQVGPVQAGFTPTESEIAQARRIVEAHAAHQEAGAGAFALDGKMVDMPVARAAERVLARARAAGIDV
jgi:citrate lyase beta subunit